MSNSYTKAAFGLAVTTAEADLLRRVVAAIALIGDADTSIATLEAHFATIGPDFAALFPRTDASPFDGLLDLFPDASYPVLDCDIEIGEPDAVGQVLVFLSGEQFGIEAAANLIQRCARSALPFGFEWASDHDRLRAGEFGGGYVLITEAGIDYGSTGGMLDRALKRTRDEDEGADGFVLAIRDALHGLSFWNDTSGFDRLARARVFAEAEAADFVIPTANPQSEWLAIPAPLAL